jgi:PAS domain S-box-containing protein
MTSERLLRQSVAVARAAGGVAIAIGCAVLAGWAADLTVLKGVAVGFATMKANTAVCFIVAGLSLVLLHERDRSWRGIPLVRWIGATLALGLIGAAGVTLSEDLLQWDAGIDQILFADRSAGGILAAPGRMSPASAIDFMMVGASVLLLGARRARVAELGQYLASAVAAIATPAALGYLYSAHGLYEVGPYSTIALHTALTFLLLAIGLLAARPDAGWVRHFLLDTPSAAMGRRLVLATVVVLPALGWLRLQGQIWGLYGTEFGLGIVISSAILIFVALIGLNTRLANSAEEKIRQLSDLNELFIQYAPAPLAMFDRQMRYLGASQRWLTGYGLRRQDVLGRSHYDVFPDLPERWRAVHQRVLQGAVEQAEEDRFDRADGSMQWLRWEVHPWRLASGQIGGIVIFAEDITARKQAEQERDRLHLEVAQRSEQLRHLAFDLEVAEERERRQIARDLHDDLAQTLSAARIRLTKLCGYGVQEVDAVARQIAGLLEQADRSTRSLAAQLAPAVLYQAGLQPALESLAEQIEQAFGLAVVFEDDAVNRPLSQQARSIVYRAVRELLVNAAKHSKAESATVTVRGTDDQLIVVVADDGVGFAGPPVTPGKAVSGLSIVRERLSLIGATLELETMAGGGTVAVLSVPLSTTSPALPQATPPALAPQDELFGSVIRKAEVFEGIFEATQDAILVVDRSGRIRRINTPGARMFGYGVAELVGSALEILLPERSAARHAELRTVYHGSPRARRMGTGSELIARRKDGTEFPVDVLLSPIGSGDSAQTLAVARDITERRKWEEIAARLAAIVESATDAVIGQDLDGVIQSWNPAAERMFGYSATEVVGRNIRILIPSEQEEEEQRILERIRRGERVEPCETVRRRKDGTLLHVWLTTSPVKDSRAVVIGASKVARDLAWTRCG